MTPNPSIERQRGLGLPFILGQAQAQATSTIRSCQTLECTMLRILDLLLPDYSSRRFNCYSWNLRRRLDLGHRNLVRFASLLDVWFPAGSYLCDGTGIPGANSFSTLLASAVVAVYLWRRSILYPVLVLACTL